MFLNFWRLTRPRNTYNSILSVLNWNTTLPHLHSDVTQYVLPSIMVNRSIYCNIKTIDTKRIHLNANSLCRYEPIPFVRRTQPAITWTRNEDYRPSREDVIMDRRDCASILVPIYTCYDIPAVLEQMQMLRADSDTDAKTGPSSQILTIISIGVRTTVSRFNDNDIIIRTSHILYT